MGAYEWGEMPIRTYAANFPDSFLFWGGVEHVSPDFIPEADVLLISPPCQRFSKLGKGQAGLDHALSVHIVRIILKSNCQAILFENVPEYYQSRGFEMIKELLTQFKYWVPFELNPYDMGGIASRPRKYCVAFRESVPFRIPQLPKVRKRPKVADFLDERAVMPWREKAGSTMAYFEGAHAAKYAHTGFAKSELTLVTPDSSRVTCFAKEYFKISRTCSYLQHDKEENLWRPFSVSEVARMMNLPDWFEIPSDIPLSLGYKILGEGMDGLPTKAIAVELSAALVGQQIKKLFSVSQVEEFHLPLTETDGQFELVF
ncbi:DNA cytosine methyltransferase [Brevibacillus centrosporus]|uniref:DNA cytosine methyltransferase n=1 Tax=Brevibacillus centrosporus TaxID=54910 RepID=UPI002482DFF7|nr:DNA cytosine methyltransferase [Brevibacillus centrosporus]MEC2133433.1 DNA cytosine methyltransferase [Brevibacillus centrosporus]